MTSNTYEPRVGLRFVIHGSDFEVTYVAAGMVRYAASAGGKPHRITYGRFIELQKSGALLVKNGDVERMSTDGIDRKLPELNEAETLSTIRQTRYVEAAVTQLSHPQSQRQLKGLITTLAAELDDPKPPAPSTVAGWVRRYFHEHKNLSAFAPRNHLRGNRTLRFSIEVEALITDGIEQVYLQPERRNAKDLLAFVVGKLAERGLLDARNATIRLPSLRTIERRIKALDPYVVVMAKRGKVAADRVIRAAGRQILSPRAMFLVQIDTHYLDIILVDPDSGEIIGRPYLVCIIDVYTRAVIGMYVSMFPPSATTTLAAIKDMLTRVLRGLPGGVPVRIIPDNGVDFKNSAFVRLCGRLGIIIVPAEVRDPNDKAHIESFFRTLTHSLTQKLKGTTFSCPIERGEYDSRRRASVVLERLQSHILEWVNEVYHKTIHSRSGRAPILAWEDATKGWMAPTFSPEEVDAIARWPEQRNIHKGRVLVDGIEYFSHALATLEELGEKRVTVLVDELNLNTVFVEHPTERGILIKAESTNPRYTQDLTWYAHQEVKKIIKDMKKSDLQRLGQYAHLLAWWRLLYEIQTDSTLAKRQIAKITNGKGHKHMLSSSPSKSIVQEDVVLQSENVLVEITSDPYQENHHTIETPPETFDVLDLE